MKRTDAENEDAPEAELPVVGIADARVRLGEIADEARYLDRVTLLGKRGKPVAAVVPVSAARSRAQLAADAQISTTDLAALTGRYERLERAAEATLEGREVMWIRAYLRVWEVLTEVCADFDAAVEEAWEDEHRAERELEALKAERGMDADEIRAFYDAKHAATGGHRYAHLAPVSQLKADQATRLELAKRIGDRVQALEADLERAEQQGKGGGWELAEGQALDWRGWAERIEHLATVIASSGPHGGPGARGDVAVASQRQRLATALAQAATLLGDVDQAPAAAAKPPADVVGYMARHLWQGADHLWGPLVVSYDQLARGTSLGAESAKHSIAQLHRQGKIRMYRYINGYQTEIGPNDIHAGATFHLVLCGERPADAQRTRPMIVTDM